MKEIREISFTYDEETKKLFIEVTHQGIKHLTMDENYYAALQALESFINFYRGKIEFTIGEEYLDRQIFLNLKEVSSIKIVITDNITKEEATEIADKFVTLFNENFDLVMKCLEGSNPNYNRKSAIKMPVYKAF